MSVNIRGVRPDAMGFSRARAFSWTAIAVCLLTPLPAVGAGDIDYATARLSRKMPAVRTHQSITLDGVLDEAAWADAPVVSDFTQAEPREGQPATVRTEARVLYDSNNLYFGLTAFRDETDKLIITDLKKDFGVGDGDVVGVVLDTFHDRRNGYAFETNPAGAKFDGQVFNESEFNSNWDGVWFTKTRVLSDRWIAEIAIPFRALRFPNDPVQTWGLNFLRRVRYKNEDSQWSPIPRIRRFHHVSLAGSLEGLEGIHPSSNVRVKPYVVSSAGQAASGGSVTNNRQFDTGLDFKYGIGSGVAFDGTFNTDFSQVEADEQQVNLTRFSLFFPEKRDFFLENSGIFAFGTLGELTTRSSSATAGRQTTGGEDMIFFFSRRIGISDDGREIPILGGARLSGRAGPWSVGLLNMQTRRLGAVPSTNFTVGRVRRNVGAMSQIGAIAINKDERGTGRFNRGYGADASIRIGQELYLVSYYARTITPGRPSDDQSFRVAGAFKNRVVDLRSVYTDVGNNFNAEVGFVPRLGIRTLSDTATVRFRPRRLSGRVREIASTIEHDVFWKHGGGLETRYLDVRLPVTLQDGAVFEAGRDSTFEHLVAPFRLQSSVRVAAGDYGFTDYYASYNSSRARKISLNLKAQTGEFYNGNKATLTAGGTLRFNYRLTTSINYVRNHVTLPTQAFDTDLVTGRVNYSFSTTMFLNALLQYNTDARQWSSNVRFNIIHRPLSDLFIVYNERRDTLTSDLVDRAVIAKVTYMIGF